MLDAANIGSSRTLIVGIGRRVALVENDASEAELLGQWLASAGFRCTRYSRGQSLVRALRQESFDFLVLDRSLPASTASRYSGRLVGAFNRSVPVLLVSTSDSEVDVVTALAHGADDYMVKPLHRRELLARLEALGRRRGMSKAVQPKVIQAGALRMDCESRIASRGRLLDPSHSKRVRSCRGVSPQYWTAALSRGASQCGLESRSSANRANAARLTSPASETGWGSYHRTVGAWRLSIAAAIGCRK